MTLPRMTEAEFMQQVTDLATRRGWLWVHLATAKYADSWRTPFSGPLGKGFSDLLLLHPARCRTLFAELKRGPGEKRATPQRQLDFLEAAAAAGNETALWEPGDWAEIMVVLA